MTGGGMGSLRAGLEELLGPDGLAALSAARGGRRAYIPHRIPAGHWVEAALGRERAEALAALCGGCRIDIPQPRSRLEDRDAGIRKLRRRGWSVSAIAAVEGLSERQVRNILRH